jgi:bifunctional DNA-binding transcriptional regulator/antitoxin component of YhaV-PrlF toxin-antitoxin module
MYHSHMEKILTIDGAGRLVIPREFRARYRLRRGSRLRITEDGRCMALQPVDAEPRIAERGGLLVILSHGTGPWLDHRDLRDERLDDLERVPR